MRVAFSIRDTAAARPNRLSGESYQPSRWAWLRMPVPRGTGNSELGIVVWVNQLCAEVALEVGGDLHQGLANAFELRLAA